MSYAASDPATRFWPKVDKNGPVPAHEPELGPCWLWTASRDLHGYGQFSWPGLGRPLKSHRVAWFLDEGEWPARLVLHHCDNPSCVRRSHLFAGDQTDNMRDAARKGRTSGFSPAARANPGGRGHGGYKLSMEDAVEIRRLAPGTTRVALSRQFGVSASMISQIILGGRWR